jgi:dihydroxyacetone kinase-like protein
VELKVSEAPVDAALMHAWMQIAARLLHEACPLLTELDAARGDADHGVNMDRGFHAVVEALSADIPASAGKCLLTASAAIRVSIGGTSGPLWSAALRRAGKILETAEPTTAATLGSALAAACAAVSELGGAREGEYTMLDALCPASRAFIDATADGASLLRAAEAATLAAEQGAAATAGRIATKGRASYSGGRITPTPDPGAVSAAIVIKALQLAAQYELGSHRL